MGNLREEERLEYLLGAIFLSEPSGSCGIVGRFPDEWVAEWLGLEPHRHFGRAALQHLAAVQLAPRAAINYEKSNPRPKWRLIESFLKDIATLEAADREYVARTVSSVLDRAAMDRGIELASVDSVTACALCNLPFRTIPLSVATKDPFKPVWQAPEELCRPEVDHVVAISGLGEHSVKNLQIICRACNLAKRQQPRRRPCSGGSIRRQPRRGGPAYPPFPASPVADSKPNRSVRAVWLQ